MTEAFYDDGRGRPGISPVKVRVPAKINLFLGVGAPRLDGYHELTTVYQALALYDEVSARRGDQLTLTMEGEGAGALPLDDSNLVLRAARA
ncbi:MAG TPA: 4-(cytidine 5'-diphospho)-2-C-methyl-D-erythritol kinase, partial [Rugosimonospora sp.]|nr:4-(cytidine 5'-diphospho)-2-C-methyl-D-erythritol kinase [Rugosimonospora sp.]